MRAFMRGSNFQLAPEFRQNSFATCRFVITTSGATRKPVPTQSSEGCPVTSMRPTLESIPSMRARNPSRAAHFGGGASNLPFFTRSAGRPSRRTMASRASSSGGVRTASAPLGSNFLDRLSPVLRDVSGVEHSPSPAALRFHRLDGRRALDARAFAHGIGLARELIRRETVEDAAQFWQLPHRAGRGGFIRRHGFTLLRSPVRGENRSFLPTPASRAVDAETR